jgi:hypothetical protein
VSTGLGGPDMVPPGQEKSRRVQTARWRGERPTRAALLGRKEKLACGALLGREERSRRAKRCSARRKREKSRSSSIS